jgi:hypothetical protein
VAVATDQPPLFLGPPELPRRRDQLGDRAFSGYRRGNLYIMDSGIVWQQVDDNADPAYREFPRCRVLFDPSKGASSSSSWAWS